VRVLLALVFAAACLGVRADEAERRVPFVITPQGVVERMLELAGTGPGDLVADLGSGDGRIVIAAARRFGARGLGIELDADLVSASRENARRAGVADRVRFVQGDVLNADFSGASVVTAYLLPGLMDKLESRFIAELKPGTRIVSHSFRMTGWPPDASETLRVTGPHPGQGDESTLYLWIVPAEVRGTWVARGRRLRIEQNYQQVDVEGASGARLRGSDIAWQWPEGRFSGRVEGGRIVGELGTPDGVRALVLARER
jgi:SAM-dependent methyltransferase